MKHSCFFNEFLGYLVENKIEIFNPFDWCRETIRCSYQLFIHTYIYIYITK